MKFLVVSAATVSIIAGGTIPAFAQAPPLTRTQPRPAMFTPDPKAVPGFLDPATGNFTPLAPKGASSGETFGGTIRFHVTYKFGDYFKLSDSIFCTYGVAFGFIETASDSASSFFVTSQSIRASFNFGVGDPAIDVPIPYKFTSNTSNTADSLPPEVEIIIECVGTPDSGFGHTLSFIGPPGVLSNGDQTINKTLDF